MTIREFADRYPGTVTPVQLAAVEYIERTTSKWFLHEVGYQNAEAMVWDALEREYACPDCNGYGMVEIRSDAADVPCRKCDGTGIYTGRTIRELPESPSGTGSVSL